ncbi:uncharacterized protein LOC124651397 isoform X1 [Lolium rigidum]|uniref:uncharacterized protein LOC124651397 isoform X1 n=1 Tax=Lolium rigidum TaxID=89674 RepID=UPI001F5D3DEF|nr:uncharacterized protein LOC124651397 isoform X1 [Lolium rigidum]
MVSSSRPLPWSGSGDNSDDGGQLSRPCKRWRSLVMHVRRRRRTMDQGVFGFRGMIIGEEFMAMFLPFYANMVQRVVSEEVGKAISRHFNAAAAAPPRQLVGWNQRPRYQLMFLNGLKPVYTMMKLEAKDGSALRVAIVENLENDQSSIVRFGYLSSARVEVVVLHGNFNAKNEESWPPEEFNKHIVWGREKSAKLLNGDLTLKLSGGEAFLESANFTDNSSFTSTKKFRLGLRLVNASGERVLEGITEPFRVKERRVEGFEKHYPPLLDDEVWRLEKIGKNGAYHQALSGSGIYTVQKLLQSYKKNEQKLFKTFTKMSPAAWKAIIGHAMTCKVGDALYLYEIKENNMGLFFDAILQLVGVKFGDCYKPVDQLDQVEKNLVEILKQGAYENMKDIQYDYKMFNHSPVPLHRFHAKGASGKSNVLPNQQILNYGQYSRFPGECSNSQGFESMERVYSSQRASNQASVDMSGFLHGQTSNDVSHQIATNEFTPYNPSQGILLAGPRITQLHIPNTGRTDIGPDVTPAIVHDNIQAGRSGCTSNDVGHQIATNKFTPYKPSQGIFLPGPRITQLRIPNTERTDFGPDVTPAIVHENIQAGQIAMQFGQNGQKYSNFPEESYTSFSVGSSTSTYTNTDSTQPHFQLTSNRESFINQPDPLYSGQTLIQSHRVVTGFQPSRTNSFDSVENDQLIHRFISKMLSSEGATTPLSPRKWVKIKAALKLASVGRLSRASRRGLNSPLGRPRLVPTI